jgi:hypothetical protein
MSFTVKWTNFENKIFQIEEFFQKVALMTSMYQSSIEEEEQLILNGDKSWNL